VCFLILARRGLYGGMRMRMSFAGGGNEKDRIKNGNDRHGNKRNYVNISRSKPVLLLSY
jgi:hypothetical protein